jgi:hypothetical protein
VNKKILETLYLVRNGDALVVEHRADPVLRCRMSLVAGIMRDEQRRRRSCVLNQFRIEDITTQCLWTLAISASNFWQTSIMASFADLMYSLPCSAT